MARVVKRAAIVIVIPLLTLFGAFAALVIALQIDEERSMEPEQRQLLRGRYRQDRTPASSQSPW